jgi:hypothetical protein
MFSQHINYPILQEKPQIFAACLAVVLVLSFGLLFLSQWRRAAAIVAVIIACAWIILLLPDLGEYLSSRRATDDWIVEPFHRELHVFGYVLVFMPALFVAFGIRLLRKKTSNQAMQRTPGRFAF